MSRKWLAVGCFVVMFLVCGSTLYGRLSGTPLKMKYPGLGSLKVNWQLEDCLIKKVKFEKGGIISDFWVYLLVENTSEKNQSYRIHAACMDAKGNLVCAGNGLWSMESGEAENTYIDFNLKDYKSAKTEIKYVLFRVDS